MTHSEPLDNLEIKHWEWIIIYPHPSIPPTHKFCLNVAPSPAKNQILSVH